MENKFQKNLTKSFKIFYNIFNFQNYRSTPCLVLLLSPLHFVLCLVAIFLLFVGQFLPQFLALEALLQEGHILAQIAHQGLALGSILKDVMDILAAKFLVSKIF